LPSVEYDLRYLEIGLIELESYLLSNELYWPVHLKPPKSEPPYPELTLGSLLLARTRLSRQLDSEQEARLSRASQRLDQLQAHWQVAWGKKAAREFHARLSLWRDYLAEYRQDPVNNLDRYGYEVNRRVIAQLLTVGLAPYPFPKEDLELVSMLDGLLKAVFVAGEFIWEKELQVCFRPEPHWYLYGKPKAA
jgi:hypothetical protein